MSDKCKYQKEQKVVISVEKKLEALRRLDDSESMINLTQSGSVASFSTVAIRISMKRGETKK